MASRTVGASFTQTPLNMKPVPTLSVMISTYNNVPALQKTLWCLEQQTHTAFDVCLADDGSGEETRAFVEAYQASKPPFTLRHVWHEDVGFRKSAIMNKALAASSGAYLVFMDGDILVPKHFLAEHLRLARRGCFMAGGNQVHLPPERHALLEQPQIASGEVFTHAWLKAHTHHKGVWRFRPWVLAVAGLVDAVVVGPNLFKGCNTGCWRTDFIAAGGFNEALTGYGYEDRDLGLKLLANGVWGHRHQVALRYLHCDHARPYVSPEGIKANKAQVMQQPWWRLYSRYLLKRFTTHLHS